MVIYLQSEKATCGKAIICRFLIKNQSRFDSIELGMARIIRAEVIVSPYHALFADSSTVQHSFVPLVVQEEKHMLVKPIPRRIGSNHPTPSAMLGDQLHIEPWYPSHKYNDCAATISLRTLVKDCSNFCSRSSLPITLAAWAICLSNSSKRRNRRIKLPSYTSVILLNYLVSSLKRQMIERHTISQRMTFHVPTHRPPPSADT